MDRTNFYKKLAEMSIDPPVDRNDILTKRLGAPMKKMTYRDTCIDYVKKTMCCVNYRDYVVAELEKLEKIEQIVNSWDGSIVLSANDWKYISEIKKVLEQE